MLCECRSLRKKEIICSRRGCNQNFSLSLAKSDRNASVLPRVLRLNLLLYSFRSREYKANVTAQYLISTSSITMPSLCRGLQSFMSKLVPPPACSLFV